MAFILSSRCCCISPSGICHILLSITDALAINSARGLRIFFEGWEHSLDVFRVGGTLKCFGQSSAIFSAHCCTLKSKNSALDHPKFHLRANVYLPLVGCHAMRGITNDHNASTFAYP
jgi:hypothetical protein